MTTGLPHVSAEQATAEKGYPHPGSTINLPDSGGQIKFQYGHPDEVDRNGCFMHDVVQALINNLEVYQQEGHPMACVETERTLDAMRIVKGNILDRRSNRQERGVHETDKP